ncbi:hypothetical protein [uncultured Friedmanniella sp.]|uniref:hypothetical protein n=1 Tax=uncultured Friedmanniella sp. TaxID=335381 RepID=UPI0035C9A9BE
MKTNVVSRSLHDVGLAAWFGGTLANAVALNKAAGATSDSQSAGAVTNAGWDAWTPVNAAAVGAHLVGSVGQLSGNKSRIFSQKGVGAMSVVKTIVTAAAVGASVYSRVLGQKISKHGDVPVESGTTPNAATPPEVAKAQAQLKQLQWAIPALTGVLLVISSFAGEQQRTTSVLSGVTDKLGITS